MLEFIIVVTAINIIAFFSYGIDKRRAIKHKWRITEAFLLGIGFIGGAIGAFLGMFIFRHKTKHFYFYIVNILGLVVLFLTFYILKNKGII